MDRRQQQKNKIPLFAEDEQKPAAKYSYYCPAKHPSFDTGKCYGCTKYLDVTDDARSSISRDNKEFKETFKDKQIIEQYFSRLGDRKVEQTTHYKFNTIRNQMTIAHLGAGLVAVAAAIVFKQPEKIRCYRAFFHPPKLRLAG